MASDYIITLKRPGYRAINLVSILLLLLFLVAFFYYLLQFGWMGRNIWLLFIPVIIIALVVNGLLRRNQQDYLVHYRTELFIAALGWFLMPVYAEARYIGWAYALMAFIERFVKYPDQWAFSKENIMHLVLPKKTFEWVEVDNVMIRNNLFTLDLRNNKIIQKELDTPIDKETETEFNDWCAAQLHFKING